MYGEDLDLFGSGSLYELLCTARTRAGEDLLARWLLSPAGPDQVLERQSAIAEARGEIDLRESFALTGEDFQSEFHPASMTEWAKRPRVDFPRGTRVIAALLTGVTVITFGLYMGSVLSRTPFLAALLLNLAMVFALRSKTSAVSGAVESPARDLALASEMLKLIEQRAFQMPCFSGCAVSSGPIAYPHRRTLRNWSGW